MVVLFLVFGVVSLLSLFGAAGLIGEYINQGFSLMLGWGRWYSPLILLGLGYLLYAKEKRTVRGGIYLGILFFIISMQGLFHIFFDQTNWDYIISTGDGGGYLGLFMATLFVKLMGFWASIILLLGLFMIALMLLLNKTLNDLVGRESFVAKLLWPFNWLINKLFRRGEEDEGEEEKENEEEEEHEEEEVEEEEEHEEGESEEGEEDEEDENKFKRKEVKLEPIVAKKIEKKKVKVESIWEPINIDIDFPIDYLSGKVGKSVAGDIKMNKEIIRQTLDTFGISVEMGDVEVGPTVTRYTMKPADGIMLSKITALDSNLKLALAARAIRIEAPISGKALVGIEVPNATTAIVGLKEILSSPMMDERKNNMMLALGKDVSGEAMVYDLTDTPHLLVAGQTKSGKSVGINAMILGLLFQNSPDDLRLILVDPKRVELPVYDNIPHLLCPVVTDVPKTINALSWLLNEMDRRLDIMMQSHSRNIQSYNSKHKNSRMPYIVLVIDELADLMLTARKEVEGKLIRLLQMSRAAGIHLILATQRPSADIITGVIKANMPARIAFAVKSGVDSRTILDEMGAEKLLGKGDMLFMATEYPKAKRLQGAFVSESEVKKIVGYLIAEGGVGVGYMDGVLDKQKVNGIGGHGLDGNSGSDDNEDGGGDALFQEAKEIVISSGKASTSYLQRRLSIGYGRAARMIDLLEESGIIGATNGSKPREVLVSKEQYEAMIDQGVSGVSVHRREDSIAPDSFLNVDIGDMEEEIDDAEEFEEAEQELLETIKDKKGKKKAVEVEEDEEDDSESEEEDEKEEDEESENEEPEDQDGEEEEETEDEAEEEASDEDDENEDSKDDESDEEEEEEIKLEPKKIVKKGKVTPKAKAEKVKSSSSVDEDDFDRLFSR